MRFFLISFATINLIACQDKDEIPPSITFLTPSENTQFQIAEQIVVEANVSDNDIVERVTFRIRGEDSNNSVGGTVTVFPNKKDANVRAVLQIRDSLIKADRYFLEVEASDGENEHSEFRFIRIEELIKRKISTMVTTSNRSGTRTNVYEDNNDSIFRIVNSYPYDFRASQLNNDDQHYWFVPKNHNEIFVQNVKTNQQVYSEQYNSSFSDPFVGLERLDRAMYLGIKQEVDGFTERFSDKFTALLARDRILSSISVNEDYLLVSETDLQGNNGVLKIFNVNSSGAAMNSIQINQDVRDAFIYGRDRGVVFYNTEFNGTTIGAVGHFDLDGISIREVEFTSSPLRQVLQISENEYLIATNTAILIYRVSTENAFVFDLVHFPLLHYDDFSRELFVGSNHELRVYPYPRNDFRVMEVFSNNIKSIATRYNKN